MQSFQVLTIADAPSREGSQTAITSEPLFSEIKPKRSDKVEKLFQSLTESLSSKIPVLDVEGEDSGDNEREGTPQSTSPASTISSSGEVKGEYTIVPADEHPLAIEEDENSQDEVDSDQSVEGEVMYTFTVHVRCTEIV